MTTIRIIRNATYPKQARFVGTSAYEAAFVGGIGSGKTFAGCQRAILASQGMIGGKSIQTPNLGVVTAPTYDMLRDATMRTFFEIADELVTQFNKNENLVTLKNGSEIIFRSTHKPERLRGPSIAWWFADEAALSEAKVWKIMIGRLRQHGRRGHAWLATTPRGRNWVWQTFVQTQRIGRKIFKASSADNVYMDAEIVEAWRREYTGDFALQELEGEFVAFEGLIYSEFRREAHVRVTRPERFQYTIAGVDWGFANPGVIIIFGVDGDGRMWQVAEHYQRQRRIEEWALVARQAQDTWDIQTFFCDPSEPDYIEAFIEHGARAQPANNTVNPGIQVVKSRLAIQADGQTRLSISPDCVHTISEFESYQWATNRHGMRDQPVKANDHAMDALRYACMGMGQPETSEGMVLYAEPYSIGGGSY